MANIYYILVAVVLILVYCKIIKIRFGGKNNKDIHPNNEQNNNYRQNTLPQIYEYILKSDENQQNNENEEDYANDYYGGIASNVSYNEGKGDGNSKDKKDEEE